MNNHRTFDTRRPADDEDFRVTLALLNWCCHTHPKGFELLGNFLQKVWERKALERSYETPDAER